MSEDYEQMSYEDLEKLSQQLHAEMLDLKKERRLVAQAMNRKLNAELEDNPPDPGMVIGG